MPTDPIAATTTLPRKNTRFSKQVFLPFQAVWNVFSLQRLLKPATISNGVVSNDAVEIKVEFSHHLKKRVHPAGLLSGRRLLKSLMSRKKNLFMTNQEMPNAIPPDITTPLIPFPNQLPVTGTTNLGLLNSFIGTWNSPTGNAATGYNVMPLPQTTALHGYIVKNFPYFEEITFSPIAGGAPNREGQFTQASAVLFYEQRVYFANNPDPNGKQPIQNTLIHAENGTWLYHTIGLQLDGPYGPRNVPPPNPLPKQNLATQYNKQISVPHGNSVLMVGGAGATGTGIPDFPMADKSFPPFNNGSFLVTDPATVLTKQLQDLANQGITVTNYSSISVSSDNPGGGISNIHFENDYSKVVSMNTTWYIETLSNNTVQLQYLQTIELQFMINGVPTNFLHIDANTLQLVETFFQVNALQPWQDTGITVNPGAPVTITYKAGQWTADPNTNNGQLYDANGCTGITVTQSGYPLEGVNMGCLVGRVGNNPVFFIGDGPVQTPAGQTGVLSLCINDDLNGKYGKGLTDNIGSIDVRIKF